MAIRPGRGSRRRSLRSRRPTGLAPTPATTPHGQNAWRKGFDASERRDYKPAQPAATSRRLLFSTLDTGGCLGRSGLRTRPMANTSSARKAARVIARRTEVNKARRSGMRTSVRKVEDAVTAGDRNAALAALKVAEPELKRAAQKGVIHRNAANRKISRLAKRVAKLGK